MTLHTLLEEQISKYLPKEVGNPALKNLLSAVSDSYAAFEKERAERQNPAAEITNNAEAALRQSEEKYRNIIEKSADIIYKTDRYGVFTFVNPVAERITGYSENELLTKHFSELIREDFQKVANSIYRKQVVFKKATTYLEFPIITKTGKEKWIGQSVQYSPLKDDNFELMALAIDITDRKIAEKTVQLREEKYRNIIANINMGLVEVDLNEVIRYCNQGFCDLSGFTKNELVGKNIVDTLVAEASKNLLVNKTKQRSNGKSDIYEIQIRNKKGEVRWWMVSGAPNYDDAGNLIGSIGIHLDVTERKVLEQELKVSKQNAEESSKAKEAFLANMSHEIRTPLNAIIGMIRELSYENLTENQRTYVEHTSTASQHLLSVLNNILDISKIEAGEFKLEAQPFHLEDLLNKSIAILKNSASQKGIFLKTSISKKIKRVLIGDPTRIRQVILNLVGNAIKFTEKGGVSVNCELENETSGSQTLLFSVTDSGIGMSEKYVKEIFTKFSQEDASTARHHGGTGLGMAIAGELIQLMKGSIDVKSERNVGTTVTINLNLPVGKETEHPGGNDVHSSKVTEPIKVLLTEDNEFNRLVATRTLSRNNCIVTPAVNGAEAIEKIRGERFDIILMDLQMPVMDGIEATKRIRNTLGIDTPIIALSANAFKTEIDQCYIIGMNDYVTKPFEEKFLIDSIHKNLKKQKSMETSGPKTTANLTKLYDISGLNDLTGGDDECLGQLVDLFIGQTRTGVTELKEALKTKDLKKIFEVSHQLKPSLDGFNIDSLKDEIREIEKDAKSGVYTEKLEKLVKYTGDTLHKVINELQHEFCTGDLRPIYEYQP